MGIFGGTVGYVLGFMLSEIFAYLYHIINPNVRHIKIYINRYEDTRITINLLYTYI